MRARQPDKADFVERDGVPLYFEVFGDGNAPTVLLLPTWSIIHSRFWKAQVPYLARHHRVVTFDGRGSGRSGRPAGAPAYADEEYAVDAVAVMDATGTDRAVLVGLSCGATWGVHVAAGWPDRVLGLIAIGPACGIGIAATRARGIRLERRPRHHRGLGEVQPPLLARGRLRRLPAVLLRPHVRRTPLHQADRGLHRVGTRDRTGNARGHHRRAAGMRGCRVPARRAPVCQGPLPDSGRARQRGPDPDTRGWGAAGGVDRRLAGNHRGRRARASGPRPRGHQPRSSRSSSTGCGPTNRLRGPAGPVP